MSESCSNDTLARTRKMDRDKPVVSHTNRKTKIVDCIDYISDFAKLVKHTGHSVNTHTMVPYNDVICSYIENEDITDMYQYILGIQSENKATITRLKQKDDFLIKNDTLENNDIKALYASIYMDSQMLNKNQLTYKSLVGRLNKLLLSKTQLCMLIPEHDKETKSRILELSNMLRDLEVLKKNFINPIVGKYNSSQEQPN